jgi:ribonuclease HII
MITIGSDEVGYGALAGPLLVVGVSMPSNWTLEGLRDSKKLTERQRQDLWRRLQDEIAKNGKWHFSIKAADLIDTQGVGDCLVKAHTEVLEKLRLSITGPHEIIVDGVLKLPDVPNCRAIPKADDKIPVVSAASVIAKVMRDSMMKSYDDGFPGYGFAKHKGYGTKAHYAAIEQLGLCRIHRRSYLKSFLRNP